MKEDIIEGNRLIALFMASFEEFESDGLTVENDILYKGALNSMHYHDDWNWIMSVVQKCMTVGDNTDMWDMLFNALSFTNNTILFEVVIDFIKWYNTQKENG